MDRGEISDARRIYLDLTNQVLPAQWQALVENNLGTIDAVAGEIAKARDWCFQPRSCFAGSGAASVPARILTR